MSGRVREFFDADADKFGSDRWEHDLVAVTERVLTDSIVEQALDLMETLTPSTLRRALDLGCGPGAWLSKLHQRCPTIGVDISARMLQISSEVSPGVLLRQADIGAELPVESGSISFVLMSHSLEYVWDTSKLANELKRVCRPNAIVCIITKNRWALVWRLFKLVSDLFKANPIPPQKWRDERQLASELGIKIHVSTGVFPRFPSKFNDVNDAWPNRLIKGYIGFPLLVRGMAKTGLSLFSWHVGVIGTMPS